MIQEVETEHWDINGSISELAYLTHNFYRFYGKFPSAIPKRLIEEYGDNHDTVLDNYVGSGTTLVEAKLAGINSVGVDIHPLGILASKVKTRVYDINILKNRWDGLYTQVEPQVLLLRHTSSLFNMNIKTEQVDEAVSKVRLVFKDVDKWFDDHAIVELALLKECILKLPEDEYREFFTLAFASIIRRVSRAYDGEVRPHINPRKKHRPVWEAYRKKTNEMIDRAAEFRLFADNGAFAEAFLADNRKINEIDLCNRHPIGLIISHPPYLNCFDFLPAFKLQLLWSLGMSEVWHEYTLEQIKGMEIRCWPATDEKIFEGYFRENKAAYQNAFDVLKQDGRCCIVIGDATIRKKVIRVHEMFIDFCQDIGFRLEKVFYRTTHYGTGKYAYEDRADYHISQYGKRDAILVMRK